MKNAKILKILSLLFIIFNFARAYEDRVSISRRLNFYKNIKKYSDNTMTVGYSAEKGLFCVANDFIEYGKSTLQVPRTLSLSPFYLFPFKFEIVSYLKEIENLRNSIGLQQKFSVFVLTYYLLYFTSDSKEEVKNYIIENKLEQYYQLEQTDESFADSFPKTVLNLAILEHDHYELLKELGFNINKLNELESVFNHVLGKVYKSEHMEGMFPWITDFQKFKWAYSIVMSRSMTLRYKEFMQLDNTKEKMRTFSKWDEINHEMNMYFSKKTGSPALIAFIDLCNHYQPRYADLRDKRAIVLDTEYFNFINRAVKPYHRGDEITYTYISDPSNSAMFLHYGFILPNNIFDVITFDVDYDKGLSLDQFNLCQELGCIDSSVKDRSKIPKFVQVNLRLGQTNDFLINYGRVKNLKGKFDFKKHLKTLLKDQPISYENEVSAWLYYLKNSKTLLRLDKVQKSLNGAQKFRDICKKIEEEWRDEDTQRLEWMNNKAYETIHLFSLYIENILIEHSLRSLNKIIYNTKIQLDDIRERYITEYID